MTESNKWRRGSTQVMASRSVDLWRPEDRLPREPDAVRAGRARLTRALQRSRDRFLQPALDKRWA